MKNKIKNILKYILTYTTLAIMGAFLFFSGLSAQADTIDYELLTNNYINTIYFNTNNMLDTQSNISFVNVDNFNMINTKYPYATANTPLNRELIVYNTTKTINTNMALYMKYNEVATRINFLLNRETQFSFISNTTPTTINGNLNVYQFTNEIQFDTIEILNNYIGSPNENSFYFTILNANERAYNEGYNAALQKYNNLNNQYNSLQQQYNSLQQQYNELATNEYTFENLFWSIGSVPMAFLLQGFNVNVLGLNLRAIITGLITALVIIYLIKKLIK